MTKINKIISMIISLIMLLSVFSIPGISAFATDYEKYVPEAQNNFETAPTLVLNQSDTFYRYRGIYLYEGKKYYVSESQKTYKFIPTKSGYYQIDVTVNSNNTSYYVVWGKNYNKKNNTFEMVGSSDGFIETNSGVKNNRAAAYLTAGKTYYAVIDTFVDNYDIEPETNKVKHTIKITNHTHDYNVDIYHGTYQTTAYYDCKICDKYYSSVFCAPSSMTLSATSYIYDGKIKKPSVTVKDSNGKVISSSYYTVSYSSDRKNVGKYKVTVKFKDVYSGYKSISKTFTIKPKSTSISKLTAGKKQFTVKWNKQATQTSGYQIQYSTDKNFSKNNKTVTITKNTTTSKTISGLSGNKKYYMRIRTYKKINGETYFSSWSKTKYITTKK